MHFQVKTPENVRKNEFREKPTGNEVLVMFLDFKMLTES